MARARLSESDYELVNKDQDIRGWKVVDSSGAELGTVIEMIIDTDAERVDQLVLGSGREVAVRDVRLGDHEVLLGPGAAGSSQASETQAQGKDTEETVRLPVMEQELRIGKREVLRGGVRVHTKVEERPVHEQVTLREEQVAVSRRPMDVPVSTGFIDRVSPEAVEVSAQAEVAVVSKQPRVVEEVLVRKDVEERVERVRETVRHTDVDVEPLKPGPPARRS